MENFKFALVTADLANSVKLKWNYDRDDCTGFMSWVPIWDGVLYSFDAMKTDFSILYEYDCVMFSGHPYYLNEIISIATALKGKVVTMFLPEGDLSLYDLNGINSFNTEIYKAWNAVDILASMEEDKSSYYSLFTDALVKFIHVPIDENMESGMLKVPLECKSQNILVYGDNNPNCPVTAIAIAKKINRPLVTVCIDEQKVLQIKQLFNVNIEYATSKLGQYPYLRVLGRCYLNIYPTRWIGSSRQPIACAIVGTPCIGSNRSHTQKRLFPQLSCDIYDVDKMTDLSLKLYRDKDFYNEIVNYAWEQLPFYNLENTKKRFIDAYDEIKERWKN